MSEPVDQADTLHGAPSTEAFAAPPRLLGGRYLLEERVASGGMASVWRAHDQLLARIVAVKLLHDHLASDEAFRERFRREAIAAARLSHPNVVAVYDTGSDEGRTYLVMEFVHGVTLREVMGDLGVLDPGQAAAIGEKVARALAYAHERGLVHRDVKPANILIGEDGAVKVTDFGIAKAADEDKRDLTSTGMVLGTAAYVAPEQIVGEAVDGRADQYALACVLYEALTGRRPFSAESAVATAAMRLQAAPPPLHSVQPGIPRALEAVVARALARAPEQRFPSAAAFADALGAFADADTDQTASLASVSTSVFPAQPVFEEEAPARSSAGRETSKRNGNGWTMLLAVVLLLAALGSVAVATGVLTLDQIPRVFAARNAQPPPPPAPAPALIAPKAIGSFDPYGDDRRENDADLKAILDPDQETVWRTDLYNTAAFGNLKSGVGFYVDLGSQVHLSELAVRTATPGIAYEIRVADTLPRTLQRWRQLREVRRARPLETFRFREPVAARYVLVWVTGDLQRYKGRYAAAFSAIAMSGVKPTLPQ